MTIDAKVLYDELCKELRRSQARARAADICEDYDSVISEMGISAGILTAIEWVRAFSGFPSDLPKVD